MHLLKQSSKPKAASRKRRKFELMCTLSDYRHCQQAEQLQTQTDYERSNTHVSSLYNEEEIMKAPTKKK